MGISSKLFVTLKESEELNESKPSLAFDESRGIQEFTDLIKMDGGEPETEYEKLAMDLDRLQKHGQYDIHDQWKAKVDKLPTEEQILQWAQKKFDIKQGDKISDEAQAAIDKVTAKVNATRESYGEEYDEQVNKWIADCRELKSKMDAIPEEKRGKRWEEWKQIDKANTDEFEEQLKKSWEAMHKGI